MSENRSSENEGAKRHPLLAMTEGAGLVIVDVQEKFAPVIPGFDGIVKNVVALIKGFQEFDLPVLLTEQYPKGLGKTVQGIAECFSAPDVVEKTTFSSMQTEEFADRIAGLGFKDFVVCGIEAHVCVHQTVCDMLFSGYRVWVPWDATGSREPKNRDLAMRRMEKAGAIPTSTEMHLFEMIRRAGTECFKKIQPWIK